MSQLIRSKQLDHSKNCFSLLSTIQQKWKYINQVRGTCSGNNRITVLQNSFSEMITQDKKIAFRIGRKSGLASLIQRIHQSGKGKGTETFILLHKLLASCHVLT